MADRLSLPYLGLSLFKQFVSPWMKQIFGQSFSLKILTDINTDLKLLLPKSHLMIKCVLQPRICQWSNVISKPVRVQIFSFLVLLILKKGV